MLQELSLLLVGAAIGGVGAWIAQVRRERSRRSQRAEDALLRWISAQDGALRKLVVLSESVVQQPDSIGRHDQILDEYALSEAKLSAAIDAADELSMFDSGPSKKLKMRKDIVSGLTQLLSLLTKQLRVIIQHHRTHIRHESTIALSRSLVERTKGPRPGETPEIAAERLEIHSQVTAMYEEAVEHMRTCGARLSDDARELAQKLPAILNQLAVWKALLLSK